MSEKEKLAEKSLNLQGCLQLVQLSPGCIFPELSPVGVGFLIVPLPLYHPVPYT